MRFPETFCFQLTAEEIKNLTSQFVISSITNKRRVRNINKRVA